MNFLKKGPELKLSELKVPDFLFDIYYDLKERHLLPLAAVLAISIVVVPIALSRATGPASAAEEEAAVATPSVAAAGGSTLVVAKSAPGLRDYRRRLRDAHVLDPFRESSAKAEAAASASETATTPMASEAAGEATSPPAEVPVELTPPAAEIPAETGGGESAAAPEVKAKFASTTLDVRVVSVPQQTDGARASGKPSGQVRKDLPELTMLPSRQAPVAVFMGTSSDGKKALLLVSSDVQSIFGDGQCIIGSQTCQLLALEQGVPETFVYGPQARTYRIEILKLTKTLSSKPRKAALGKSKSKAGDRKAPESAGRVSSAQPR